MPAHFSIKHVRLFALMLAGLVLIVAAHLIEPQYLSRNAKYLIKTFHAPGFAFVSLVLVWIFDNYTENQLESIEAELVYLVRNKTNSWPRFQNEIHFNNNFAKGKKIATQIFELINDE